MPELILYHFERCPFCRKVFRYLEDKDIEVEYRNILKNREAAEELLRVGGKDQVPCLFIDGEPLYESDDIIQWFEDYLQ